tara:strand:+ start:220 stop:363 length:144 start_codon:yes stop_codon:yes gene_type:complete
MERVAVDYIEWQWECPSCGMEDTALHMERYNLEITCDNCGYEYEVIA